VSSTDKEQENLAIISQIADKRKEKATSRLSVKNAVVRFRKKHPASGKKLTYVAIFSAGRWWTTSTTRPESSVVNVRNIYSHEQFLDLMTHPDVSRVEVATAWTPVE